MISQEMQILLFKKYQNPDNSIHVSNNQHSRDNLVEKAFVYRIKHIIHPGKYRPPSPPYTKRSINGILKPAIRDTLYKTFILNDNILIIYKSESTIHVKYMYNKTSKVKNNMLK